MINPLLENVVYNPIDNATRHEIAHALRACYRLGEGTDIDSVNLVKTIRNKALRKRLKQFATRFSIFKNVVDARATTYIYPPQRTFEGASKKQQKKFEELYHKIKFNSRMLELEKQVEYEGTVLVKPEVNPRTKELFFLKITPSMNDVNVDSDAYVPDQAAEISYTSVLNDKKIMFFWDNKKYIAKEILKGNQEIIIEEYEHKYEKPPFVVLRLDLDSSVFWGPVDNDSYTFFRSTSLLLASSMLATRTDMFNILVLSGYSESEALKALQSLNPGKVLLAEAEDKDKGRSGQDAKYITPEQATANEQWQLYLEMVRHYRHVKGIPSRNFDPGTGRDPQSGEAQKNADQPSIMYARNKKTIFSYFEQEWLDLYIHYNNNFTSNPKLPEDIKVVLDWPDVSMFTNATDKKAYEEFALKNDIITGPQIIRGNNPDISKQKAEEIYLENKEFNRANTNSVAVENEFDEDIEDAEAEVAGKKELGNPIQKEKDNKGNYVRWGDTGKKYYYNPNSEQSFKTAKAKALKQGRVIKAQEQQRR